MKCGEKRLGVLIDEVRISKVFEKVSTVVHLDACYLKRDFTNKDS